MTSEDTAAPSPTPTPVPPPSCKLFVAYAYTRAEDKQERHGRIFITGVYDLLMQNEVEVLEQRILEHLGTLVVEVRILNWKRLIG